MAKNVRYVSLDLLRGLAALAIVAFHAMHRLVPALDPLAVCVDLFFVLSGFVLAPIFPNQKGAAKAFILKRALRFWPMAVTALFVKLALILQQTLTGNSLGGQNTALSFVGALLLLQIFYEPSLMWIVPLWSLSAEWFSNLIAIPVLLRKSLKLEIFVVLIGLVLIGFGTRIGSDISIENTGSFLPLALGRALVGLFIGILLRRNLERLRKLWLFNNLIVASGIFIGLYILIYAFKSPAYLVAAFFVSPLIVAVALRNDAVIASRLFGFAKESGNLSFGIYVWHVVTFNVISRVLIKFGVHTNDSLRDAFILFVLAVPASVLATIATQRFVERPIHRRFAKRSQPEVGTVSSSS